jgi:TRAP-type C4-dicarboxylate transport system permease small subunit
MTETAGSQPGVPGGSAAGHGLLARIRTSWELSKPRDVLVAEDGQRGSRSGWIEKTQELLAGVAFVATFASIVVEVGARYLFDRPQVWSLELPTYFFLWSFALAAGLSDWRDDQIGFDLLAQRLPRRIRLAGAAVANVLIVAPMAAVLPGTLSYLSLIGQQPNTGLPGSQLWGYAGVFLLFAIAALLRARLLVIEVLELFRESPARPEAAP